VIHESGQHLLRRHSSAFTGCVPLVRASDQKQAGFTLEPQTPAELSTQDADIQSGYRRIVVWRLAAKNKLVYKLRFTP
jgi:hypothetical protein